MSAKLFEYQKAFITCITCFFTTNNLECSQHANLNSILQMGEVRPFLDGYHEERLEQRAVAPLGDDSAYTNSMVTTVWSKKSL